MEEKEYWKNLQVIFWLLSCGEKKTKREFQVLAKIIFFSQPIKLEIYFSIAAGTVCKAPYFDSS